MVFAKFRSENPYLSGKLPAAIARVISLLADKSPADLLENMRSTVLRRDLRRGRCRGLHGVRTRKTVAARRYNKSPLSIGE